MYVLLLTIVIFGLINGRWLVTRGQTVGKRLVGVRIVDARTREVVPLVKSYGLRFIVVQAITQVPFVGADPRAGGPAVHLRRAAALPARLPGRHDRGPGG